MFKSILYSTFFFCDLSLEIHDHRAYKTKSCTKTKKKSIDLKACCKVSWCTKNNNIICHRWRLFCRNFWDILEYANVQGANCYFYIHLWRALKYTEIM